MQKSGKKRNTRIGSAYYKSLYADEFPHAKVSDCVCVCMFECLLMQACAQVSMDVSVCVQTYACISECVCVCVCHIEQRGQPYSSAAATKHVQAPNYLC